MIDYDGKDENIENHIKYRYWIDLGNPDSMAVIPGAIHFCQTHINFSKNKVIRNES